VLIPVELTDPERRLWDGIQAGEIVDLLEGGSSEDRDPGKGAEWGAERTVRAHVVAALITDEGLAGEGLAGEGLAGGRRVLALRLRHARISGALDLADRVVRCPVDLDSCYFDHPIQIQEARTRRLVLRACELPGLLATRLRATGEIDLSRSHVGQVVLTEARVGAPLRLSGAQLGSDATDVALDAEGAHIDGEMCCKEGRVEGELRLVGAHIRGRLDLGEARLVNAGGDVLNADRAQVDLGMFCPLLDAEGELRMLGAHITGQLSLIGARLSNRGRDALSADGAEIDGGAFCEGLRVDGEMRLPAAHISGQLDLTRARLNNPGGYALSAERAQIDGGLFCRGFFKAEGELRLLHAHIAGQLDFTDAQLVNAGAEALCFDNAQINCSVFCRGFFKAEGELRLLGAHITGQFDLSSARLVNPSGRALYADYAQVDGAMLCNNGFKAEGQLRMIGAQVNGQFNLSDAHLGGECEIALNLERTTLRHLVLPGFRSPDGDVDLRDAQIARLDDNWATTKYTPRLSGLTYEMLPSDISQRLEWLAAASDHYAPQPYEQLASFLRRTGRSDAAREVAIAKEKSRRGTLSLPGVVWNHVLAVTVGYGYKVGRGVAWLTGVVLAGWLIFALAYADHDIVNTAKTNGTVPQFHAWLYSLDTVLPAVNLKQEDYWSPVGIALYWHTISMLAGWLLVTLIIGTLTARLVRE
jgi:hypothetical protein